MPVEYRDTSASDTAYAELIMELWTSSPKGFVVWEHDVVLTPEQLDSLVECERSYCAFPYPWTTNLAPALGATKFGSRLLMEIPTPKLTGISHRQLDVALMRFILGRVHHQQPHVHLPPAEHMNERQALRPEFQHLTLAEHLAALGYEISDDGHTADYVRATREFGEVGVRA